MKAKRAVKRLFFVGLAVAALTLYIDFVRFPECYISTWRYQLENGVKSGDPEAIDLYQRCYVEKGKILFE